MNKFEQIYNSIKDPFRYTFLCYGQMGWGLYNWLQAEGKRYAGIVIFPEQIAQGTMLPPVMTDIRDNWTARAITIDPLDNLKAQMVIEHMTHNVSRMVLVGKESNDN